MRFTGKIKFHGGKSQDFSENHLQKKETWHIINVIECEVFLWSN